MPHVDPDLLALLALGEQVASAGDHAHLETCGECEAEVQNLARAALVGRSTLDAGELAVPDDRVWARIVEELSVGAPLGDSIADDPVARGAIRDRSARARSARVRNIRSGRPYYALAAVAAGVLVIGGGIATWRALSPTPSDVLASASLDAFPEWEGSSGTASVERIGDGPRVVEVSVDAGALDASYLEVWLIASDSTGLVSLGVVNGTSGTFTIPEGLDISKYDLVDISAEPYDGDPAHSGDSIVRGQLS